MKLIPLLLMVTWCCLCSQMSLFGQSAPKQLIKYSEIVIKGNASPGQLSKGGEIYYFFQHNRSQAQGAGLRKIKLSRSGLTMLPDSLKVSGNYFDIIRFGTLSLSRRDRAGVFSASKSSLWQGNTLFSFEKMGALYKIDSRLDALKESKKASASPWISADGKHLYFIKENSIYHSYRADLKSDFVEMKLLPIDVSQIKNDIVSIFLNRKESVIYILLSDNSIFMSSRPDSRSEFSQANLFATWKENSAKYFFSGMGFTEDQRSAIFFSEEKSTNIQRVIEYKIM